MKTEQKDLWNSRMKVEQEDNYGTGGRRWNKGG
jgi:hypothetical protein